MASKAVFKVSLLIPLHDNDGLSFDLAVWTWWNDRLTALVAGFTDLGVVSGWWRGYPDRNRWQVMIVSSMREVDAIRELLREARPRFRQEAMYLEYHSVHFDEVT